VLPEHTFNTTGASTTVTKIRISAKSDPDAAKLATAAKEIARAAGLKSAYLPLEAREVMDHLSVTKARGALLITRDGGEPVRIKTAVLQSYIDGASRDEAGVGDAAKAMAEFSRGLEGTLYGRKTAVFITAISNQRTR
jgi:hypothetical protein